jgi:predicted heme/steroid binding protein/uncharacterized membrane protein
MVNSRKQKYFTKKELLLFDGEGGKQAYVAFKGKVYDVTNSRLWINGKHQARHSAGEDLTQSLLAAPHNEEHLTKFPIVGELVKELDNSKLAPRVQKLHLHPISVHFSIAYSIAFSLLSILYFVTGETSFETASYYMLLLGFLSAPVAAFSGFLSWRTTYKGKKMSIFTRKINFAIIFLVVITICLAWRTLNPGILIARTGISFLYLSMGVSLTPIVTILGYFGGKIVYP